METVIIVFVLCHTFFIKIIRGVQKLNVFAFPERFFQGIGIVYETSFLQSPREHLTIRFINPHHDQAVVSFFKKVILSKVQFMDAVITEHQVFGKHCNYFITVVNTLLHVNFKRLPRHSLRVPRETLLK